jgi:hypothetical protein
MNNPMPFNERDLPSSSEAVGLKELPEWLQREADAITAQRNRDQRLVVAAAAAVLAAGILAILWLAGVIGA